MPAHPLVDKALIMRLLDELAEYRLSDEEVDLAILPDLTGLSGRIHAAIFSF